MKKINKKYFKDVNKELEDYFKTKDGNEIFTDKHKEEIIKIVVDSVMKIVRKNMTKELK